MRRTCRALLFATALAATSTAPWLATPGLAGPTLLYDADTERVLYAEDADEPWFAASLTKMMTAYLVFEAWRDGRLTKETPVVVSARANAQPKMRLGLAKGKSLTADEAVTALIMLSANDIAVALAEAVSGSEDAFVAEMNKTAIRLGMTGTQFINPNGLPGEGQHTTAKDMAMLTQALLHDFPEHSQYFSASAAKVGKRQIATHNPVLVNVLGGDGMKTGFTCSAGYNIVASATRDGRRLIAVVLGEQSSAKRARRVFGLIEHGFLVLQWKDLFAAPIVAGLPADSYDRAMVREANLAKRLDGCRDPDFVPRSLIAAIGETAERATDPGAAARVAVKSAVDVLTPKAASAGTGSKKKSTRPSSKGPKSTRKKKPARRSDVDTNSIPTLAAGD